MSWAISVLWRLRHVFRNRCLVIGWWRLWVTTDCRNRRWRCCRAVRKKGNGWRCLVIIWTDWISAKAAKGKGAILSGLRLSRAGIGAKAGRRFLFVFFFWKRGMMYRAVVLFLFSGISIQRRRRRQLTAMTTNNDDRYMCQNIVCLMYIKGYLVFSFIVSISVHWLDEFSRWRMKNPVAIRCVAGNDLPTARNGRNRIRESRTFSRWCT